MSLWTLAEVLAATNGKAQHCRSVDFDGVSIDSLDLSQNDLFVAIKGDRFDGHQFVEQAIENGAEAALVSAHWAAGHPTKVPHIVVDDPFSESTGLGRG